MDGKELERGPRAVDTIDLNNSYQVAQWTEIFNVSSAELTAAVLANGTSVVDVRQYLRARKSLAGG
jgi:hypothetical protein